MKDRLLDLLVIVLIVPAGLISAIWMFPEAFIKAWRRIIKLRGELKR